MLELPDGVLGTVRANWCSPSDHRNVICQTRIHGASGMIFINLASTTDRVVVFSPERELPNATPIEYSGMTNCYRPQLESYDNDLEIMRAFAEQIRAGRGGKTGGNLSRARHVIEVIDKIYASSASGTAEPIDVR